VVWPLDLLISAFDRHNDIHDRVTRARQERDSIRSMSSPWHLAGHHDTD
jgi:hypothetical protein